MRTKHVISFIGMAGLLAGMLFSRDVVELAKKEMERRANDKSKKELDAAQAAQKK